MLLFFFTCQVSGPTDSTRSATDSTRSAPNLRETAPLSGGMARLLVLGGTGFVGLEVCRAAVRDGFSVTALSRRGKPSCALDSELAKVQWIACDATQSGRLRAIIGTQS